ncbi:DivIVA domain-containing protein [Saccharibacillus sp. CPCC 101409]|uniref:DivIVA domain-containing protein n=1 Tax=Saccharibacillus sp. CPCC 101409 TaxID=3058041 RepID=UPI002673C462|nr:DivIVA domain-containing protein [Saccharibacillus sp. CPCC 101409]MDO3408498.1 DivIVA domain-containing protein [Saccharibacillus sp. CPCC 101409]
MDEQFQRQLEDQKRLFKQLGLKLDALQIHEKDFPVKMRGYTKEDVDAFLDDIITDYERFHQVISDLLDKYNALQRRHGYDLEKKDSEIARLAEKAKVQDYLVDRRIVEEAVQDMERTLQAAKRRIRPSDSYSDPY